MSAYWKFDPYKDREPETPAKVAKVAKEGTGKTTTLAGLATLAAPPADNANFSFRSVAFKGEADEGHRTLAVVPSLTDIPTDWVLGLRAMAETPCPITIEPKRWLQLRHDAQRFVDQWGPQAAALGWSTLDIFGCHPTHRGSLDYMGLVWMVAGAEVVAIGARVANLRNSAGTLQRVWKCAVDVSRILLWDL
jgi:hypothetical protein